MKLKKNEERRLLAGHLWVFSNEIDVATTPLKSFEPGEIINILSSRGDNLGTGYINPHSLIAARLCSRDKHGLSKDWFRARLRAALELRELVYDKPFYRLVHGEGDLLPGLVIDRFDQVVVMQVTTAGMEQHIDLVVELLGDLLSPQCVVLRNDNTIRELEHLTLYQRTELGQTPEQLSVEENGLRYEAAVVDGQKTGWFYDHRDNRAAIHPYVKNKRVLDCYSYLGAWGLNALAQGASEAVCVDSSLPALQAAQDNAALNGFTGSLHTRHGDAVEALRELFQENERFDVVVLDPPAFIKRKKDFRAGFNQYELINRLAVRLLRSGGTLVSASCSQPLQSSDLSGAMLRGARRNKVELQLLQSLGQARDHPVNAAMPETAYLKGFIARPAG
ncbi:MAG: class I SAM-dependent rRNA methyltransferase [Granulosicoccus sp.]|nr:class I SAM-dependent rRNA methyltransferase [Granulosicoccus sp.]